jgi:hypothetical protein
MLISELFKETGVGQRKVKKAYEWLRSKVAKQEIQVIGARGMFKTSDIVGEHSDHEKTEYLDLDITTDDNLTEIKTILSEEFAVSGQSKQMSALGMSIQKLGQADETMSKEQLLEMMREVHNTYEESRREKAAKIQKGRLRKKMND